MKMKGKIILLNLFIIFAFVSCRTTDTITQASEDLPLEEEIKAPQLPKQYTNINVVPPPETNLKEEEIAERQQKKDELVEITKDMTEEQRKFYYIKKTYDYDVVGRDLDYKIMVNHDYKELIIQFEESDSKEDWWNNFLFYPNE